MNAFTNQGVAFEATDFEDQTPTVDLDKLTVTTNCRTYWTGLQMLDVDGNAYGGITLANLRSNGFQTRLLHQGNHGGSGKYFQCA